MGTGIIETLLFLYGTQPKDIAHIECNLKVFHRAAFYPFHVGKIIREHDRGKHQLVDILDKPRRRLGYRLIGYTLIFGRYTGGIPAVGKHPLVDIPVFDVGIFDFLDQSAVICLSAQTIGKRKTKIETVGRKIGTDITVDFGLPRRYPQGR